MHPTDSGMRIRAIESELEEIETRIAALGGSRAAPSAWRGSWFAALVLAPYAIPLVVMSMEATRSMDGGDAIVTAGTATFLFVLSAGSAALVLAATVGAARGREWARRAAVGVLGVGGAVVAAFVVEAMSHVVSGRADSAEFFVIALAPWGAASVWVAWRLFRADRAVSA